MVQPDRGLGRRTLDHKCTAPIVILEVTVDVLPGLIAELLSMRRGAKDGSDDLYVVRETENEKGPK